MPQTSRSFHYEEAGLREQSLRFWEGGAPKRHLPLQRLPEPQTLIHPGELHNFMDATNYITPTVGIFKGGNLPFPLLPT